MVWNSLGDFFAMGGYGLYVWGSAAVTFGFMIIEVFILRSRRRSALKQIERSRLISESEDAVEAASNVAGSNAA